MATATMGLRRRVQVGNSSSVVAQTSNSGSSKRSRSENNNSPSQGNLNSLGEPASKKSRSSSGRDTRSATKAKELEKKVPHGPPHWADPRPYASIAGLSLNAQQALCQAEAAAGLPSPMAYLASTTMATFVGNAASSLGKSPAVSYLDISNMTARPPGGWASEAEAKNALGQLFSSGSLAAVTSAFTATSTSQASSNSSSASTSSEASTEEKKEQSQQQQQSQIALPKNFPNDSMFNAYQPWVIKTYGDLAKTKTITIKKYARILRTLRGEEVNSAENSKFRFWVKSKGFHIGQPEGYEPKPADRIVGRHAVTNPGLDPPLYVPTQPPHNKTLNGAEGTVPPGRVYKKVAIVENFFDIIHAVHVDLEGRPGKHAGQKRTYRTITETYAFLPREAVTRFLLGCTECQRRPRTPSPTSNLTAATSAPATSTTPTPTSSATPPPPSQTEKPPSPKPATTLSSVSEKEESEEKPIEASHAPDSDSIVIVDDVKEELQEESVKEEPKSLATEAVTAETSTATATATTSQSTNTTAETSSSSSSSSSSASKPKMLTRDEKYNPLSITNLLRKDPPVARRPPIPIIQHIPEPHIPEQQPHIPAASEPSGNTATTTSAMSSASTANDSTSTTSVALPKKLRMLPAAGSRNHRSTPSPMANLPQPWGPQLDPKYSPIDYSLPITVSYLSHHQRLTAAARAAAEEKARLKKAKKKKTENSSSESESDEEPDFSPAAGLIDTNLNLLATIQQLHCQVMLALTERLRPAVPSSPGGVVVPTSTSAGPPAAGAASTSGGSSSGNDS